MDKRETLISNYVIKSGQLVSLCLSFRHCALVALQDVKVYLTDEGGQIAVSPAIFSSHLIVLSHQKHILLGANDP